MVASFGEGSGQIFLDDVKCTGNESTLLSCPQLSLTLQHNCDHSEDVGVRCSGTELQLALACTVISQVTTGGHHMVACSILNMNMVYVTFCSVLGDGARVLVNHKRCLN